MNLQDIKKELLAKAEMYKAWEAHFNDLELYALADEVADDLDKTIQALYVVETQIQREETK